MLLAFLEVFLLIWENRIHDRLAFNVMRLANPNILIKPHFQFTKQHLNCLDFFQISAGHGNEGRKGFILSCPIFHPKTWSHENFYTNDPCEKKSCILDPALITDALVLINLGPHQCISFISTKNYTTGTNKSHNTYLHFPIFHFQRPLKGRPTVDVVRLNP